jgi:hypothetical protein
MHHRVPSAVLVAVALALTACSDDDGDDAATVDTTTAAAPADEGDASESGGESATGTDCPFLAVYEPGDTTYDNTPTDGDYINALRPHVAHLHLQAGCRRPRPPRWRSWPSPRSS